MESIPASCRGGKAQLSPLSERRGLPTGDTPTIGLTHYNWKWNRRVKTRRHLISVKYLFIAETFYLSKIHRPKINIILIAENRKTACQNTENFMSILMKVDPILRCKAQSIKLFLSVYRPSPYSDWTGNTLNPIFRVLPVSKEILVLRNSYRNNSITLQQPRESNIPHSDRPLN